jgi:hypothetical protein
VCVCGVCGFVGVCVCVVWVWGGYVCVCVWEGEGKLAPLTLGVNLVCCETHMK